jgi:DNA invertase Pin-like site-specific DNA recombinase
MSRHSTPAIGFSYIRFSSPEQAKGDSLRRQTANTAAWCERNGVQLDTSLSLRDLGVSAFKGRHRDDKFALGQFLKLAERGRIPKGSYLIIENLDRLSREDERKALRVWMDILDAGINIVQLTPETIFRHERTDMVDVMRAIIELSRGHSESRIKSERVGAVWAERKRLAREEGKITAGRRPAWITERDGKPALIADRAAVIRRIYDLATRGYGCGQIARKLTSEGVKGFGRSGRWSFAYIALLLRDRRVLGEYQPKRKDGTPDGEVIPNYFPEVVSPGQWYAAQQSKSGRWTGRKEAKPAELETIDALHMQGNSVAAIGRTLGISRPQVYRALVKLGRREQPAAQAERPVYLFLGMVKSDWGNQPYHLVTWFCRGKPFKSLVSVDASQSFSYFVLERALLSALTEINPREILDGANGHDDVMALEGELGEVESSVAAIEAELDKHGESPSLFKRLRAKEARLAELNKQLAAARQKAANPLSASWGECKSLLATLDSAADVQDARTRLRAALRRIVLRIDMQVVAKGMDRLAFVQILFTGEHENRFRSYRICYRRPRANATVSYPGGWCCASMAGPDEEPDNADEGVTIEEYLLSWHAEIAADPSVWQPLPE